MSQPIILALDTSTQACSVAINNTQGELFFEDTLTPQSHANQILQMIETLMHQADVKPEDLDVLAYGQGPGAFTGIRIAAGVIQGLALGWDKPVIGLSSLESIAKACVQTQKAQFEEFSSIEWISLVDARMQEVYWQNGLLNHQQDWQAYEIEMLPAGEFLKKLHNRLECFARDTLNASENKALVVCGDIAKEYPQAVALIQDFAAKTDAGVFWFDGLPSATAMIKLAAKNIQDAKFTSETLPKPLYLRNHVADTIAEREAKKQARQNQPG